jgi:hypothetical protein
MKTTNERIEEIVKDYKFTDPNTDEIEKKILILRLENLVTQAKLEQLRGDKE